MHDRFMDNFVHQFLSMDNFIEKIFKIVKIVHGKFKIFIQTYGNPSPKPNPIFVHGEFKCYFLNIAKIVHGQFCDILFFINKNCPWTIVDCPLSIVHETGPKIHSFDFFN